MNERMAQKSVFLPWAHAVGTALSVYSSRRAVVPPHVTLDLNPSGEVTCTFERWILRRLVAEHHGWTGCLGLEEQATLC